MKDKVMIAMSGGVDSSVSAYLLKEQGYEVIGVTMQIWQGVSERTDTCCSLTAVDDARRVAEILDIPYYVLNFKDIFQEKVIKYFIEEYTNGRTPNPCIVCNRDVKFEALLNKAISMDIPYIATGHYAKIEKENNRYLLKKSRNKEKDQSYVLYNLTQYQLAHTMFPLGDFDDKEKVRDIARQLGLSIANKPDSQEICFIEDNDYAQFISSNSNLENKEGYIVDIDGNILGKHNGIYRYTIGQRHGLGISLNKPMYVKEINVSRNEVVLGNKEEILSTELIAKDINLISMDKLTNSMEVTAKIRYGASEAEAILIPIDNENVKVEFKKPQRAITPGQSVVFYDNDIVIGGGIIS